MFDIALHLIPIVALLACSNPAARPAPASPQVSFPLRLAPATATGVSQQSPWTQAELEKASQEIQRQIEVLREAKFKRPVAVRLADKQQFLEYAKRRMELTEPPEKIAGDEMIAKLLGVIPPDMDLLATGMKLLESQVGGFYDPSSDSFSLMDQCPPGVAKIVLAHELGHALDDQLFGIDARLDELKSNGDAGLAYTSVVEGSGTTVMNRWMLAHMSDIDLSGFEDLQRETTRGLAEAPLWVWKPLLASYMRGASFLVRTENLMEGQMKPASNDDIATAFKQPPRSMEQVLHPDKYWSADQRDEPTRVSFDTSELESDWHVLREDTLGELLVAIVTTHPDQRGGLDMSNPMAVLAIAFTNVIAEGWDGDRVILVGEGQARYLRWVTRWDSPRDAGEFLGAASLLVPSLVEAARALADEKDDCDAEVQYGKSEDEVILAVWSGVKKRDRKMLERAVRHTSSAD